LFVAPASAQFAPMVQGPVSSGPTYSGIGDCSGCTGTPTLYYGLRAMNAGELTGSVNALRIRVTSGGPFDIAILTNGSLDMATADTDAGSFVCTSASATATNVLTVAGCASTPVVGSTLTGTVSSGALPQPNYVSAVSVTAGSGTITVQAGLVPANFTVVMSSLTVQGPMFATILYARGSDANGCAGSTSCNLLQATSTNQPQLLPNCQGSLPCLADANATGSGAFMQSANNFAPATGILSLSSVSARVAGTGGQTFFTENSTANYISGGNGSANKWRLFAGATGASVTAADGIFHAGNGIILNAASGSCAASTEACLSIDGTDSATPVTTLSSTAGKPILGTSWASGTFLLWAEGAFWDNTTSTASQRAAQHTNQSAYYGTP
jgi:hypothetical protein